MFARRAFSNGLTNALKENPNMRLEDVLLHSELSSTLRNEADELMKYLGAADPDNQGCPRIRTVVKWALALENNERLGREFNERYRLFQVNRNASTLLAYASQRLCDDLLLTDNFFMDEILRFPRLGLAENATFAGHWQRLIEMFLRRCPRKKLTERSEDLKHLFNFIITHADILAYQYLISRLITDFQDALAIVWPVDAVSNFIIEVLDEACRQVFFVRSRIRESEEGRKDMGSRLVWSKLAGSSGRGGWLEWRSFGRPMTWEHKIVPVPLYLMKPSVLLDRQVPQPAGQIEHDTVMHLVQQLYNRPSTQFEVDWTMRVFRGPVQERAPPPDSKLGDAINRSYLLLNAIQTAYLEAQNILEFLQKEEIVGRLLVCGVFCDPVSMVSSQAFRLVRLILSPTCLGRRKTNPNPC
jgi:hypothetical protein